MSNRQELLIRVDAHDQIIGYESKEHCHQGNGLLHRAFSIFIFNEQQQLLHLFVNSPPGVIIP